jgi:LacI family transcriptional regulator
MKPIVRPSLVEVTAEHLRQGIREGRWQHQLPGVRPLAIEFSVSKETVRAALSLLEKERWVSCQGAGRFRQILSSPPTLQEGRGTLRVAILLRLPLERLSALSQGHMVALMHEVRMAGHQAFVASRYPRTPGKDGTTLKRLVAETQADAWIAYSASHEVLAWFASQRLPVFALGGHPKDLDIPWACSDQSEALQSAVTSLVAKGHRRIVLITSDKWLRPKTNASALVFANCLRAQGLSVTDYNLPYWDMTPEGLEQLLSSLFHTTPPTALLIQEPAWTVATLGWLLQRGLNVPEDVSLVSLQPDPALHFWRPAIAHFHWLTAPHIHHAMKWLRSLVEGSAHPGSRRVRVTFVAEGTVGVARSAFSASQRSKG